MRYTFHPEALQEYSEAVKYYAERDVNLAQRFINSVDEIDHYLNSMKTQI